MQAVEVQIGGFRKPVDQPQLHRVARAHFQQRRLKGALVREQAHCASADVGGSRNRLEPGFKQAILRANNAGGGRRQELSAAEETHGYFAGRIDSTLMIFVFSYKTPVTTTFCPANFSGIC